MHGRVVLGDPHGRWSGAVLDSRRVSGGELFFALAGEHTDGHRFVADSLERGAAGAVVETEVARPGRSGSAETGAVIRVEDSLGALHALTREVRKRLPGRLVAVTGSAGKTTTKDLVAEMLSRRFKVARNPGNLNNLFGFPISLLSIPEGTEWMVAEMGMSTPGELRRLADLGRPDLVVYTNVRPVHLEFFDGVSDIAEAKAELLEGLSSDGIVVANADDPEVVRIVERHRGRVVWYGLGESARYGAEKLHELPKGGSRFDFRVDGELYPGELPLYGLHNVENFLAAAACAHTAGVSPEEILRAAAEARPASMRGVVHELAAGGLVVDDSYNSNPDALRRSLESARALDGKRHWAVLGSMLELGVASEEFHRQAGREAVELGFSPVIAVGAEARALAAGARDAGGSALWIAEAIEAAGTARAELRSGDVVLIKGSRGIGLETVVSGLLEEAP